MRVISLKPLREFWEQHPDSEQALRLWYKTVLRAEWGNLSEARRTYPHADGVKTRAGDTPTVFNIGGNRYRLIARIRYDHQLVNIRHVLTHDEYDHADWKD